MSKSLGHKIFTLKWFCRWIFTFLFFSNSIIAIAIESETPPAAAAAEEAGEKSKKENLPPWTEIQNKIQQLEAKMQQKRENIEKLIVEKQHVKSNSIQVKEIINQMIVEHKELQGYATEYEKTITILKFRFPERGARADRKYEPTEVKTLDEMEKQMGIDSRLTRNVKKMRSQYSGNSGVTSTNVQDQKTVPVPNKNEKSIEESGTIILRK